MTQRSYSSALSAAQGIIPETLELLAIWEAGMSARELRARAVETGALGKATQRRVDDIIGRGFAQRLLTEGGIPARHLKALASRGTLRGITRQLLLLFTARSQLVLRDFIVQVYWTKANSRSQHLSKEDARDFLERARAAGQPGMAWSDGMMERMTQNLLGTLADFEWIGPNRPGRREIRPPAMLPETALYLAHDLRFRGLDSHELVRHPDWQIFGLMPADAVALLEKLAGQGHLQVQNAGAILRIEWIHPDMEHVIDAILDRKI